MTDPGEYLTQPEKAKPMVEHTAGRVCRDCSHWSPYLRTLGECTRTVPMSDTTAEDSCRAWTERTKAQGGEL